MEYDKVRERLLARLDTSLAIIGLELKSAENRLDAARASEQMAEEQMGQLRQVLAAPPAASDSPSPSKSEEPSERNICEPGVPRELCPRCKRYKGEFGESCNVSVAWVLSTRHSADGPLEVDGVFASEDGALGYISGNHHGYRIDETWLNVPGAPRKVWAVQFGGMMSDTQKVFSSRAAAEKAISGASIYYITEYEVADA